MDIQKKIETERFVRELLAELDKMSREELGDFRPKMLRKCGGLVGFIKNQKSS